MAGPVAAADIERAVVGAGASASEGRLPLSQPQRTTGAARLSLVARGGVTCLERLYQLGAAKLRFPHARGRALVAVLINTAGGVTGGDRLDWRVELEAGARCTVVTQAYEKAYRAEGSEPARITMTARIGPGARLNWLPQETILFDEAHLARRFEIDMAPDACLLAVEAVILGRRARGEIALSARLADQWRVRRAGRLVYADALRLTVSAATTRPALIDGGALALVMLIAPDAASRLEAARAALPEDAGRAGLSAFDDKLICRIVARDGVDLRRQLLPLIRALNDGAPAPRIWTI